MDDEALGFPFTELDRTPLAHVRVAGQPLLIVYVKAVATAVASARRAGDLAVG